MRKSLWIMLAVLLVAIATPAGHADGVYAITFSGAGAPTVVGSNLLDYNSTLKEFTTPSLEIKFDGLDITLDNLNRGPVSPSDQISWDGPEESSGNPFFITDDTTSTFIYAGTTPFDSGIAFHEGSVTLTATPEPSSYALMLLGAGLVFVLRKRIGQRLPQVS